MNGKLISVLLQAIGLASLLVLVSSCETGSGSQGPREVKISPRLSDDSIRNEMLKYTPIGCSPADVRQFVTTRLKHVAAP